MLHTLKMSLLWECAQDRGEDERSILANTLPAGYEYKITYFKLNERADHDLESHFICSAKVKLGLCTKESVEEFLQAFYQNSNTTYNKFRADTENVKHPADSLFTKCGAETYNIISDA